MKDSSYNKISIDGDVVEIITSDYTQSYWNTKQFLEVNLLEGDKKEQGS